MTKGKEMLIVLGLDERGKPHAAKFAAAQAEAVKKAAGLMGFQCVAPKTDEAIAQADRLPPGKLFATGKGMVSFIKLETYTKLLGALNLSEDTNLVPATAKTSKRQGETGPDCPPPTPAPKTNGAAQPISKDAWAALKVGDKVIAPEKRADDGFWPGVIVSATKTHLTVRWLVGVQSQPPVTLKRQVVAILYPA